MTGVMDGHVFYMKGSRKNWFPVSVEENSNPGGTLSDVLLEEWNATVLSADSQFVCFRKKICSQQYSRTSTVKSVDAHGTAANRTLKTSPKLLKSSLMSPRLRFALF